MVDRRCKMLQENAPLHEWEWPSWSDVKDVGKSVVKGAADLGAGYFIPGMQGAQIAYDASKGGEHMLDRVQSGLDIAGMIPGIGAIPDAANIGISGIRGAMTDDPEKIKKHKQNAALSTAALVPLAGIAAGGSKVALKAAPKVAQTVKNTGKAIKGSDMWKSFKNAKTVYKADKLTGGHASDAVGNVKQNVQQAGGPSGIFSKMYQNYKNK